MKFTHLHCHSHYSLLDGLAKVDQLVAKAKADGMESLALTDHANMYGIIEFYQKCTKAGIKPIIGSELYIAPYGYKNKGTKRDEERYHLTVLAKNNTGYHNLIKLISHAHIDGYYMYPRVDLELLSKYKEGLIALSGTIHGEIPQAILSSDAQKVYGVIEKYVSIFGKEDFYFELQRHPHIEGQDTVNARLLELVAELGIRAVATSDIHYLNAEDDKAQDLLSCIKDGHKVSDTNRSSMMGEDFSFKTTGDMVRLWSDHPEVVHTTQEIVDKCSVTIRFGENILPHFDVPEGYTTESYLKLLCYRGLVKRYGGALSSEGDWDIDENQTLIHSNYGDFRKQDILDRLTYELSVINKTGYPSYFLIVADFINWAKEQGVVVGPGRGSAAGSLVAYVMNITNLDPLKYDLLFERFLNPERVSMPDIDIDFADTRRDDVIHYVENKYGKDQVGQIITFGTMAAKAAVRDVGRALGIEYMYCDKISKMIPFGATLDEALESVEELKQEYQMNPDCREMLQFAKKLEGVCRHTSTHACGVLITPRPLSDFTPIQFAANDDAAIVSQYSLHPVEDLGLLKMDFLGLSNMTLLENTLETIQKVHDVSVNLDTLPLDDSKTYSLLQRGETTGVFQLESNGMKRYLKQLKPNTFEDIIAMVALYRPGPMELIPEYISNKHGKTTPVYLHPKLESILNATNGIAVYQEQLMKIAQELAGFSLGEADILRKAVGKKIKELLQEQKDKFVAGCLKNGVEKKVAEQVFAFIEPFAGYGFNRSHAACYALIAYQTAYFKANYPSEFMASLLTSDLHNIDRVAIEVAECRLMGIEVLPPDINESYTRFTVLPESLQAGKPCIRFGLGAIKNVGEHITKVIIHERKNNGPYTSLENFLSRVNDKDLNKKSLESLIRSGALDRFGDRNLLYLNLERILQFVKSSHAAQNSSQHSLFSGMAGQALQLQLEDFPEVELRVKLSWEKELLGLYISEHPFSEYQKQLDGLIVPTKDIGKLGAAGSIRIAGVINTVKKITTKKGDLMAFVTIEDTFGTIEVIVFPNTFTDTKNLWVEDSMVIVNGTISDRDGQHQVICNEVKVLNAAEVQKLSKQLQRVQAQIKDEYKNMFIFFKQVVDAQTIKRLNDILKHSKGSNKVFFGVPIDKTKFRKIETNFYADFENPQLQEAIQSVQGVAFIKLM